MDILKRRWIYIFNGFIVLLFMGCGLAWSIFVVPIENAFHWTRDQTSLAFTINILCFSVGSILTGILSKHFSLSTLLKISAFMMGIGFYLASYMNHIFMLYLSYGIIVGVGIGLGYNCVVSSCPLWLPEKTATATGILLMGYALSTAIFGPLLNSLIHSIGITSTFRVLAFICGLGIFLGSILLKQPTVEEVKQLPQVDRHSHKKSYNIITSQMIRMPLFWCYYLITVLFGGVGLVIINHCSPMLTEGLAISATLAAFVMSIASLFNGVSRFLWGIILDKFGVVRCLALIGLCLITASFGLYMSYTYQLSLIFMISACLMLFSYGGNAMTCPSVIREMFGHRTFSLNYSVLATNSIFTSCFPAIAGILQVQTKGYQIPLFLLAVISLISIIVLIIFSNLYHKRFDFQEK